MPSNIIYIFTEKTAKGNKVTAVTMLPFKISKKVT